MPRRAIQIRSSSIMTSAKAVRRNGQASELIHEEISSAIIDHRIPRPEP